MKFREWFYCQPHTCILIAYWERSPWSVSLEPLAQRCYQCWNIFRTPVVEYLSVLSSHFFFGISSISLNLCPFKEDYFWKHPQLIRSQIKGRGWLFHSSKRLLRQRLLDRGALWSGALSWWRIQSLGQHSGPILRTAFICDFYMRALLGRGDVSCIHCKIWRLLSEAYWKHHVLSPS